MGSRCLSQAVNGGVAAHILDDFPVNYRETLRDILDKKNNTETHHIRNSDIKTMFIVGKATYNCFMLKK